MAISTYGKNSFVLESEKFFKENAFLIKSFTRHPRASAILIARISGFITASVHYHPTSIMSPYKLYNLKLCYCQRRIFLGHLQENDLKHSIEERFELMRSKKIPTYKTQKYKAEQWLKRNAKNIIITENLHCIGSVGHERVTLLRFETLRQDGKQKLWRTRKLRN